MPTIQLLSNLEDGSIGALNIGSSGPEVRILQDTLRVWGFDPGPTDGNYGQKTKEAVAAVQRKLGLTADGIWGPKTLEATNRDTANPATSVLLKSAKVLSLRLPSSSLPGAAPAAQVPAGPEAQAVGVAVPVYQQPWFLPAVLIGGGALAYFLFLKKGGKGAAPAATAGSDGISSDLDMLGEELSALEDKPKRRRSSKPRSKRR